ncbi:MAG TPA: DoxX family protein [Casimicrobiaceae bacterium]
MLDSLKTPFVLVGRILIAFMFMQSGYEKLTDLTGTAGYIASGGLPNSTALAGLTGVFELVGGLAILIGFKARWAALVLAAFTLVASFLYHRYWTVPADQQLVVQLLFMKNMAIVGGLLVIAALGAGPASLDARKST